MSRDGIPQIDTSTPAGARAADRLQNELVGWLTTVRANGTPQSSPIWFIWDGETFLIYSLESARVANIDGHARVSLNLNSNSGGGDIVVVEGDAAIDRSKPAVADNPDYLAKYGPTMADRDWSPEWFGGRYSAPVVITPTKFRYW